MDSLIEATLEALKKHRFEAIYAPTAEDARKKVLEMIPPDVTVGAGGSMTTRNMGIVSALEERGNMVFDHTKPGITPEEKRRITLAQLTSDVFLTGTNAVTTEGELINVDGAGNRIAAMSYGPERVIVVVGKNKIVPNREAGFERIRAIAAPKNAIRLSMQTPCTVKGYCQDCSSPQRICNATHILHRPLVRTSVTVVIVDEDLGF